MSDLTYEWLCVGCGLEISGPDESRVAASVERHKARCVRFQEWVEEPHE